MSFFCALLFLCAMLSPCEGFGNDDHDPTKPKALAFYTIVSTGTTQACVQTDEQTYTVANKNGGSTIFVNATIKIPTSSVAPVMMARGDLHDHTEYGAYGTIDFMNQYRDGIAKHGWLFNPDSIYNAAAGSVSMAGQPAGASLIVLQPGGKKSSILPVHILGLKSTQDGYELRVRQPFYSASSLSARLEPHRIMHGDFDANDPHFHTYPKPGTDLIGLPQGEKFCSDKFVIEMYLPCTIGLALWNPIIDATVNHGCTSCAKAKIPLPSWL